MPSAGLVGFDLAGRIDVVVVVDVAVLLTLVFDRELEAAVVVAIPVSIATVSTTTEAAADVGPLAMRCFFVGGARMVDVSAEFAGLFCGSKAAGAVGI